MYTNEKAAPAGAGTASRNNTHAHVSNHSPREQRPDSLLLQTAGIPDDLKATARWVLWRHTWNGGKWAKKPLQARGGYPASSVKPSDWTDYDTALAAYSEALTSFDGEPFDGLGFVLGDGYHGIDVDGCRAPDGSLSPLALEALAEVPGYAEVSPSGQGLKIITRSNLDRSRTRHEIGLETYTAGRYFTITGHRLNGHDRLPETPVDLSGFALKHFGATRSTTAGDSFSIPRPPLDVTPEQIRATLSACLRAGKLDSYSDWLEIGMALHHQFQGDEDGLDVWDEYSSQAAGYSGREALETRWRGFDAGQGDGVTFATPLKWANDLAVPTESVIVDLTMLDRELPTLPQDWVDALIPAGVVTLLGGHGGSGKSALALLMGAHLACGIPFAGRTVRQGRVLFVSCEDDGTRLLHRLHRVRQYLGADAASLQQNLRLLDMTRHDPTLYQERGTAGHVTRQYDWLLRQVNDFAADVIIMDNASDAFAANENNRPMVRAFIRSLAGLIQERGGAVLLLAHIDKQAARNGGGGENYSGSTAWNNSVRSRLAITGQSEGALTLTHEKANHSAKAPDIPLHWQNWIPVPRHDGGAFAVAEDTAARHLSVLRLIDEHFGRGSFMSPQANAKTQAHIILSRDPACFVDRRDIAGIVMGLERAGDIAREEYRTSERKSGHRWRVTEAGQTRLAQCAPCAQS